MRTPVTPNYHIPIGQSNTYTRAMNRDHAEDLPENILESVSTETRPQPMTSKSSSFPVQSAAPISLNATQEEDYRLTAQEVDDMLTAALDDGIAIDTKKLAKELREELESNSISLAKFAKIMYGWDSHGNLSDLLRKPKLWETLSGKVRFNYLLMHNWMSQPLEKRLLMFEVRTEQAKRASEAAKVQSENMIVNQSDTVSLTPSSTLSTQEVEDLLDAALDENTSIDTMELAVKLRAELKENSISLQKFARSLFGWKHHSTLSDLLRVPMPWEALKAKGRFNYLRMHNWMNQPLESRLMMLEVMAEQAKRASELAPPVPTKTVRKRRISTPEQEEPVPKRSRLFTKIQKKKLVATFDAIPRPSKPCKRFIAESLDLEKITVDNFFKNSRARQQQAKVADKTTL